MLAKKGEKKNLQKCHPIIYIEIVYKCILLYFHNS